MIINVKVKPNSKREAIEKIDKVSYLVSVKVPARDGKANSKLIKILAREFGVNLNAIKIKSPFSQKKIVEIRGIE